MEYRRKIETKRVLKGGPAKQARTLISSRFTWEYYGTQKTDEQLALTL